MLTKQFTETQSSAMKILAGKAGLAGLNPAIGPPVVDALTDNQDAVGVSFLLIAASANLHTTYSYTYILLFRPLL